MQKLTMLLLVVLLSFTGCVPADKDLSGTFVAGHLGNYSDCPSEGFGGENEAVRASDSAGACFDGSDCGGGIYNCEAASVTVEVSNDGNLPHELEVVSLELFDASGKFVAELPALSITPTDGENATLAPGDSRQFRIEFAGPAHPWDLLESKDSSGTGMMVITLRAVGSKRTFTIESTELFALPAVVT